LSGGQENTRKPPSKLAKIDSAKFQTSQGVSTDNQKEIDRLQQLIAHRDNEISESSGQSCQDFACAELYVPFLAVLIDIINKYKEQSRNGPIDSVKVESALKSNITELLAEPVYKSRESNISRQSIPISQTNSSESLFNVTATASTPNLAKSMPQLSTEKARVFEVFRREYPGIEWIDSQKALLKEKYAEAKGLGEEANRLRCGIRKSQINVMNIISAWCLLRIYM
jgi:kinesin family protein 6/9